MLKSYNKFNTIGIEGRLGELGWEGGAANVSEILKDAGNYNLGGGGGGGGLGGCWVG